MGGFGPIFQSALGGGKIKDNTVNTVLPDTVLSGGKTIFFWIFSPPWAKGLILFFLRIFYIYILCVQEVVTSIYIMSYYQIGVTTSWTHGT